MSLERNPGGAAGAPGIVEEAREPHPDSPDRRSDQDPAQVCTHCGAVLPDRQRGRPQKFCSDRCRQADRKSGAGRGNGLRYRTGRPTPISAPQAAEAAGEFTPEKPSPKSNLRLERVNEVTFKITDGEMSKVPHSHGQWGGYHTPIALAWVIDVGSTAGVSSAWLARCRDRACGPVPFNEAKAAAFAMAKGAIGDVAVEDPIRFLHKLQAELAEIGGAS